ncbi:MAG: hypothetical protein ACLRR6_02680 [Oscillospiraceae bacterium]
MSTLYLDEHKNIIRAVAGDAVKAHRAGCAFLDALYQKPISERADIVLVSQGGAPKDLNLYQTQKALDNAKHAVRDGGVIIVIGSCREGLGEDVFEQWIQEADNPSDLTERVKNTSSWADTKRQPLLWFWSMRIFISSQRCRTNLFANAS